MASPSTRREDRALRPSCASSVVPFSSMYTTGTYPESSAAAYIERSILIGPYSEYACTRMPIWRERPAANDCARTLGSYPSSAIAISTLFLVSGRSFGLLLRTRETVIWETPASSATSRMLGAFRPTKLVSRQQNLM